QLRQNAAKTAWVHEVLYSFGTRSGDGIKPEATVVIDKSGDLYGTTTNGGSGIFSNKGTGFRLTLRAAGTKWTEQVLYSFCTQIACVDGTNPAAGVLIDKKSGRLYGTTSDGGANFISGGAYALIPNAAKTSWKKQVLVSFCPSFEACSNGDTPEA